MYVDFSKLKELATQFHEAYEADGGLDAYMEGRHVYSIEFHPEYTGVRVHVAWQLFKKFIDHHVCGCLEVSKVSPKDLHLSSSTMNCVDVVACMSLWDLKREFKTLGVTEIDFDQDIMLIFNEWQKRTGWGLQTYQEVESNG